MQQKKAGRGYFRLKYEIILKVKRIFYISTQYVAKLCSNGSAYINRWGADVWEG